jgi:signal transduction histidine kinase/ligand-binding sensor domain-containing protein
MFWVIVALLGSTWLASAAAADSLTQDSGYVIRVWDTKSGLPLDAVRAIAQTPDGYLWVGTFGGLARFDGDRFEVFQVDNTPELPDNLVNALFCDSLGRLWIGHDSGHVTVMEGRRFRRIPMPPDWQRIPIRSFASDATGQVWLLNASWKLAVVDPTGRVEVVQLPSRTDVPLQLHPPAADGSVRLITQNGRCYIASGGGMKSDTNGPPAASDGRRVIPSKLGGYWWVSGGRLQRCVGDKTNEDVGEVNWGKAIFATTCEWNGMIAAGTFREGLSFAGGHGSRQRLTTDSGLPSNWISVLFADRGGNLWVGTGDGGLASIWPRRVKVCNPPGVVARRHIQSVVAGNDGGIWVATESAGLFRFKDDTWHQVPEVSAGGLPVYSALWMARDGRLWVSTPSMLHYYEAEKWQVFGGASRMTGARGVLFGQDDTLWYVASRDLVRVSGPGYTKVDRLPGCEGVCCLANDGQGGVWFGGYGTGLGHWRSDQHSFFRTKDGLPSENILSLHRTRDGSLWIGTDGKGLVRLKNGRFEAITKRNGLPSDTICQMIEDAEGRLWMGTYAGICAASLEELNQRAEGERRPLQCLVLDTADGMDSYECSAGNQPSACRTADGRLWFSTLRGVALVSPSSISINSNPPPVWIERLQTDGGSISLCQPGKALEVPLGQRRLQISFNAPCLRAARRVRFKHQLEPIDPEWLDSGGNREVTYARVPPGQYRFRVIACNEDGIWNEQGATLAITVPPFIWERAWFQPACWAAGLGTLAAVTVGFIRQRLHRRLELLEYQRAVERERSRIAKDLHDDLGGSLTEIMMLAETAGPTMSSASISPETMAQIAQRSNRLVRALDEIVWAVNPKHDSVASLAEYLSGWAQEFLMPAGVRLRLSAQRELPATLLSPEDRYSLFVAAKEALTNVVRHGNAHEVRLGFTGNSGHLHITIEDDGCGFDVATAPKGGDGLANMRDRLEHMGGRCQIASNPGKGTTVGLIFPLK